MAITLADFTKIWASTSPLTPYTFSESNYKEGWNFIGGTPPSRQMWDSVQKQNDEKLKYIVDNFLPLDGGTMTGAIVLADGGNPLSTVGGTMLGAIKGNPITLTAENGGNSASLVLGADGSAQWDGNEIERVVATADTGVRYIRFDSGLQMVFGSVSATQSGTTVNFPAPFDETNYFVSATASGYTITAGHTSATSTSIKITSSASGGASVDFLVVGWWK